MVLLLAYNPADSAVDNQHSTGSAGCHPAVKAAPFQRDTVTRRLAYGVLLGVYGPYTVLRFSSVFVNNLLHLMARVVAMGQPGRGSYVSGHQYSISPGDDTAAFPAVACSPVRNSIGYSDKVIIPAWSHLYSPSELYFSVSAILPQVSI